MDAVIALIAAVFGGLVVAYLTGQITQTSPLSSPPQMIASLAATAVAFLVALVVQRRIRQRAVDPGRAAKEFENIWPGLYKEIRQDVKNSVGDRNDHGGVVGEFLELSRNASGRWPPLHDRPASRSKATAHRVTIRSYDPRLWTALTQYYDADEKMRTASREYKRAIERNRFAVDSLERENINLRLYKCARELESKADALGMVANARNEAIGNAGK
jgi:hypothetical protein